MTLQQRLERLLRERKVTLGMISEKTGVTPRTIQNYAKGKTVPKTKEKYMTVCDQIAEEKIRIVQTKYIYVRSKFGFSFAR